MKLENSTRRCVTTARAGDNAAGEAGAGIPGRVALVVVHALVEHERGAGRVKERIRLAWLQRDGRIQYFDRELAVLRDMEVRHVAGMTVARQHAVLFIGGIEVRACRVEGRRVALTDGMDMERMLARRHSFERKLEQDSGWSLQEIDATDLLAPLVVKHGLGSLGHGRQSPGGRQQRRCADRSRIFQNRHDPTPRRGAPDGRLLEGSTWETHGGRQRFPELVADWAATLITASMLRRTAVRGRVCPFLLRLSASCRAGRSPSLGLLTKIKLIPDNV